MFGTTIPIEAPRLRRVRRMPQEFHVLQCYSCQVFQVQQVKKVNKWMCKMCASKQSVQRVFGRGSGADCRSHVQKLNMMRGELQLQQDSSTGDVEQRDEEDPPQSDDQHHSPTTGVSRWSAYVGTVECGEQQQQGDDDNDNDDDVRYTTDRRHFDGEKKQYRTRTNKRQAPYATHPKNHKNNKWNHSSQQSTSYNQASAPKFHGSFSVTVKRENTVNDTNYTSKDWQPNNSSLLGGAQTQSSVNSMKKFNYSLQSTRGKSEVPKTVVKEQGLLMNEECSTGTRNLPPNGVGENTKEEKLTHIQQEYSHQKTFQDSHLFRKESDVIDQKTSTKSSSSSKWGKFLSSAKCDEVENVDENVTSAGLFEVEGDDIEAYFEEW